MGAVASPERYRLRLVYMRGWSFARPGAHGAGKLFFEKKGFLNPAP